MNVDIVIPVYNQGPELHLVLKGFLNQNTDYSYRIIVVDDGSSDNVKQYVDLIEDSRIAYVKTENGGRSKARNFGADHGNGDVIIFNDSDRIPAPNFIQEHIDAHIKSSHNSYVFIGSPKEIYINNWYQNQKAVFQTVNTDLGARFTIFSKNVLHIYDENGSTNSKIPWISTFSGNMSINRAKFLEHRFDEEFSKWGFENIELGYRLYENGLTFRWVEKARNYHLAHARDKGFYEKGIIESHYYLIKKYGEQTPLANVRSFILGEISLQDFEKQSGSKNAVWLLSKQKEIKNKLIHVN